MDGFHRMVNDFDLVWMVNGWIFIEISLDSGDLCRAGAKRARDTGGETSSNRSERSTGFHRLVDDIYPLVSSGYLT
jgi:hypothetical protein